MITEGLTAAIGQVNSVRVTKQDMIKNGGHCKTYLYIYSPRLKSAMKDTEARKI